MINRLGNLLILFLACFFGNKIKLKFLLGPVITCVIKWLFWHPLNRKLFYLQMEQFLLADLQNVFPLDSLASSHPISVEVDHPKKIKQLFDRISYSKVN